MKFKKQEIIDAVKHVLEERQSIKRTADSIGMSKSTLQTYVAKAKEHGYACLLRSPTYRRYDGAYKIDVVEFIRENKLSSYSAAAHFNITRSVLQSWERIYLVEGKQSLYEKRRGMITMNQKPRGRPPKLDKQGEEDLIAENQRLRMENEFLKKLNALVQEREKRKEKR